MVSKPRSQLVLIALFGILPPIAKAAPLTSAFTYQGQLTDGGAPLNGQVDMRFSLYDAEALGTVVAGPVVFDGQTGNPAPVDVINGLLTVPLNFGANVFDGTALWLQIEVRSPHDPGNTGAYVSLTPRQPVTATPIALQTRGIFVDEGSGKLGVGTAAPLAELHVRAAPGQNLGGLIVTPGTSDSAAQLTLTENTSATLGGRLRYDGSANQLQMLGLGSGGTDVGPHLVVGRDDGRVGIGTTNPGDTLHVSGSGLRVDGSGGVNIRNPGNTGAIMRFDWVNDVPRLRLGGTGSGSANGFDFQRIGDQSLMRLLDNGNVGIGTTTPVSTLSIGGDATVLDGTTATIRLDAATGGTGGGAILVNDATGLKTVEIEGSEGVGGGSFMKMWNSENIQAVEIDADETNGAAIRLKNNLDQTTVEILSDISGEGRVICDVVQILGGSDLSEQFDIEADTGRPEPGMVVSIDPTNPGKLKVSQEAYDRKVAGIVSGAGGVKPGMLMGQAGTLADGAHPVALSGRVWCRVDAEFGPVQPGDLLTTSPTAGYAMKALDYDRARGAILGKAMTGLDQGRGLVLVLVQPQ